LELVFNGADVLLLDLVVTLSGWCDVTELGDCRMANDALLGGWCAVF
jgi:hypothetical protein